MHTRRDFGKAVGAGIGVLVLGCGNPGDGGLLLCTPYPSVVELAADSPSGGPTSQSSNQIILKMIHSSHKDGCAVELNELQLQLAANFPLGAIRVYKDAITTASKVAEGVEVDGKFTAGDLKLEQPAGAQRTLIITANTARATTGRSLAVRLTGVNVTIAGSKRVALSAGQLPPARTIFF